MYLLKSRVQKNNVPSPSFAHFVFEVKLSILCSSKHIDKHENSNAASKRLYAHFCGPIELHFLFLGLYRLLESMPIVTKTAFFHLAERIQESWPELIGNHEAHLEL